MIEDNARRGLMLVLSGPSGAGKSTLLRMLVERDQHVKPSISVTTRQKRPAEIEGIHYYYTNSESFKKQIKNGDFLEYAEVFNNFYGTPRARVEEMLISGLDVIFDIEWQGHRQLSQKARADVASIFILPPSREELCKRLNARGQDDPATVEKRLHKSGEEMMHWNEYDYAIVNKNIYNSLEKITNILRAERLRKARRLGLEKFVAELIAG